MEFLRRRRTLIARLGGAAGRRRIEVTRLWITEVGLRALAS
jgi:hypothetical protein